MTNPPTGAALDRALAEMLGTDRPPTREYAMCRVAGRKVSWTGNPFRLRDGRDVAVKDGGEVPQPPGTDDWNDRYWFQIAEFLGDKIASEVDAYRLDPPAYHRNASAMVEVIAAMERRGYLLAATGTVSGGFMVSFVPRSDLRHTNPDAIGGSAAGADLVPTVAEAAWRALTAGVRP